MGFGTGIGLGVGLSKTAFGSVGGGGGDTLPEISGVPTISGTTGEGDTLTFTPASVTGTPTPTRTWQVYRDAAPVGSPQSGNTYVIVEADLGTDITVQQIETNSEGTDTATSAATSIPSAPASATAMRVRESSGNAEADIPLAVDGYVDETALTTHTGAASGFVSVWHDQSGNDNDATQVTTTAQPRIVNAGTVDEAVVFDGSNDFLQTTNTIGTGKQFLAIEAWVYISDKEGSQIVFELSSNHNLFAGAVAVTFDDLSDESIGISVKAPTGWNIKTSAAIARNTWQHVVCYFDFVSATQKFALNGSIHPLNQHATYNSGIWTSTLSNDAVFIGARSGGLSAFKGSMTGIRIITPASALSDADLEAIYLGTIPAGVIAEYKATEIAHSMRVRRSNDNAERNILIADGGYVDETDLASHVGANSGFVTSWQDRSGLGNHAVQTTQVSQPRIVNAGTVDEALVFDGSDDFLTLTTPLSFAGEFTLAFWAKRDNIATRDSILSNASTDARFFFYNNSTTFFFRITSASEIVSHGVDSTQWNHFAITRNADGKVDAYVNGAFLLRLFSDVAEPGTCAINRLGVSRTDVEHLDGSLDQVYAANVALSEAQIAALMNGTLPASGTVLWLKAKEQSLIPAKAILDRSDAAILDRFDQYIEVR